MPKFQASEPFLYKYSPLTGHRDGESSPNGVQTLWFYGLTFLLSITFGMAGGYLLARQIHHNDGVDTRLTSVLHNVPWETVMFEVDERFVSANPGDPNGSIWEELQPKGQGWISVPDWEERGLPPSPGDTYLISMYHQIHCIAAIKKDMMALHLLLESDISPEMAQKVRGMVFKASHSGHCLEYLRQYVMCGGDTTLEPFVPNLGMSRIPHRCRNSATIFDYALHHRHTNLTGILG